MSSHSRLGPGAITANGFAAVTKSDDTVLPALTVALYIGGTGDLVVDGWGEGEDITLEDVPAGSLIPGNFKKVKAATTATLITVLYHVPV